MTCITELQRLGYSFYVAGNNLKYRRNASAPEPPTEVTRPLFETLRSNKKQAIEYVTAYTKDFEELKPSSAEWWANPFIEHDVRLDCVAAELDNLHSKLSVYTGGSVISAPTDVFTKALLFNYLLMCFNCPQDSDNLMNRYKSHIQALDDYKRNGFVKGVEYPMYIQYGNYMFELVRLPAKLMAYINHIGKINVYSKLEYASIIWDTVPGIKTHARAV